MITLYETILSSTKSGKNTKKREKYLLEKGFKRVSSGTYEIALHGNKGDYWCYYYVYPERDKFYIKISDRERGLVRDIKYIVETYADLDLVMQYWEAVTQKLPSETIKQHKELVKNTLHKLKLFK